MNDGGSVGGEWQSDIKQSPALLTSDESLCRMVILGPSLRPSNDMRRRSLVMRVSWMWTPYLQR